jgi:hypothetical protein
VGVRLPGRLGLSAYRLRDLFVGPSRDDQSDGTETSPVLSGHPTERSYSITLFLVAERSGEPVWVAKLLGDDIYVYDHHTKEFHVNEGLWQDYYFDQEMCFTPIDAASARESIEARVGWFDARKNPWLYKRITETAAITPEEALGDQGST